jgi:hypothetical protein
MRALGRLRAGYLRWDSPQMVVIIGNEEGVQPFTTLGQTENEIGKQKLTLLNP